MVKRALTSYDTVCWLDRLSFAQEMRESHSRNSVYTLYCFFAYFRFFICFIVPLAVYHTDNVEREQ